MTAFYALGSLALVCAIVSVALVAFRIWTKWRAATATGRTQSPRGGLPGFRIGNLMLPLAGLCMLAALGLLKAAQDAEERARTAELWQRKVESLRGANGPRTCGIGAAGLHLP